MKVSTEMSTRRISWGKDGRGVRLTNYHHPVPFSRNLGTLTSWNPLGLSRHVMGLLHLYLYLYESVISTETYSSKLKGSKLKIMQKDWRNTRVGGTLCCTLRKFRIFRKVFIL